MMKVTLKRFVIVVKKLGISMTFVSCSGYGWKGMVDWASYMSKADLMNISTITYSSLPGSKEIECIESFRQNENDFLKCKS